MLLKKKFVKAIVQRNVVKHTFMCAFPIYCSLHKRTCNDKCYYWFLYKMSPYLRLDDITNKKNKREILYRITLSVQISLYLNDMHPINR